MALSARAVLRALAYTPFVAVEALFFFAWVTLLDIHVRFTWRHLHAPWASLLNALLATALVAAAAGCFALAVLRPPGYPDRDVEGGAARRRHAELGEEAELHADDEGLEEGDNAPLLPTREPETDGERALDVALTLFPGAPQLPSRSGRRQLGDVLNAADAHLADEARGRRRLHLADVQVKSSGERRWCNKCAAPKPDRAHHCSSCKRCVLRMDHHCPWITNCVGLRNHKSFFLFLFYTCMLCIYVAQDTARVLVIWVSNEDNGFETSPIAWAVLLFISFIFGVALIPFTGYHAWLICRNRTTLESMEGAGRVRVASRPSPGRESVSERLRRLTDEGSPERETQQAETGGEQWRADEELSRDERRALKRAGKLNIYDLGVAENWRALMGRTWWQWFLPNTQPESDGYTFAVNADKLSELQQITATIRLGASSRGDGVRLAGRGSSAAGAPTTPLRAGSGAGAISSPVSSIRGRARSPPPSSLRAVPQVPDGRLSPMRRTDIAGGRLPHESAAVRQAGMRTQSAHGEVEWGAAPRRDGFVLYSVDSDDDDGTTALGSPDASRHPSPLPRHAVRREQQQDADVWG